MATALKVHLKNINGDQLHPYTTNVPIGQQFSFSEDKLQLNYDIVRSNLGISSDSLSFSLPKQIFTSATDNQLILSGLPVGIKTNKGNYYPAQKTTVTITGTDIILNLQSYLAYDNSSEFSGAWTVYYASGRDGLDGIDGTGLDIRNQYDSNTVYSKTETSMDAVQYNGSLWGYINATAGSGNPPPETSATASNDYWTLLVAKGEDGTDGVTPAIDPETKHWIIGEEDTGVLAEAKVEGGTATFSSVSENNIATLTGTSVPVGIMTNSGNYYPIEKGSVIINVSEGNIQLDVSPYLAYRGGKTGGTRKQCSFFPDRHGHYPSRRFRCDCYGNCQRGRACNA